MSPYPETQIQSKDILHRGPNGISGVWPRVVANGEVLSQRCRERGGNPGARLRVQESKVERQEHKGEKRKAEAGRGADFRAVESGTRLPSVVPPPRFRWLWADWFRAIAALTRVLLELRLNGICRSEEGQGEHGWT